MLIKIKENIYINPDQIQIVRQATHNEAVGKSLPLTTIILLDNVCLYIEGHPEDIVDKLEKGKFLKCGI